MILRDTSDFIKKLVLAYYRKKITEKNNRLPLAPKFTLLTKKDHQLFRNNQQNQPRDSRHIC